MKNRKEQSISLLESLTESPDINPTHILSLALTTEQLCLFNQAASKSDKSILSWMMEVLLDNAHNNMRM